MASIPCAASVFSPSRRSCFGGVPDQHLARPLQAVDRADAPAVVLEESRDVRIADRLVGRQDADRSHLRKFAQRLGAGQRAERYGDAGAFFQPRLELLGAGHPAPERRDRHRHDQVAGLARHHPVDRAVQIRLDRDHDLLEFGIVGQRQVGNVDAADVIGDARRPHRIGLRLHDRVGRRNDHAELEAIAEAIGHVLSPFETAWSYARSGLCFVFTGAHYDAHDDLTGRSMPNTTSNFDNQSLRGFLQMVETDYPDELLRIRQPVDHALRHDGDRVRAGTRREEPGRHLRASEPQRHAGRHQRGGKPQAARGLPRRRSRRTCRPRSASAARNTSPASWCKDAAWQDIVIEGDDARSVEAADPAAVHGRWRTLHHRRPDFGARSRHRRRHHRLSPADAQGQEPPRPLAAFAPPHVRVPAPRRGARTIAARGDHDRHPSAALHGVDGLRLPAARAEVGDHRRTVRRAVSRGALRRRRARGAGGRRDRHRRRDPGGDPGARRPVRRVHRLRLLSQHAACVRRASRAHAPRRHVPQRHLRHVEGPHPGVLRDARGRDPQHAAAQSAQRARRSRAAHVAAARSPPTFR